MEKYIRKMSHNNIIAEEDFDIIRYGLINGLGMAGILLLFTAGSLLLGIFLQSTVFMIFFLALRMYAGGYHAKTRVRCFWISVSVLALCLINIRTVMIPPAMLQIPFIFSLLIIFHLAPLTDGKRALDDSERAFFKKVTRIILSIYLLLYIICLLLNNTVILYSLLCAGILAGILVSAGYCQHKVSRHNS